MNALDIIKSLKADRKNAVLWINEERKEAAFHGGVTSYAVTVDFNAALVAKGDTSVVIIDKTDGTTYAAI